MDEWNAAETAAGEIREARELGGAATEQIEALSADLERVAPTDEVQASEIAGRVRELPGVEYEEWKELSVEERVALLNEIEGIAAEVSLREPMAVSAADLAEGVFGQQNSARGSIEINTACLADDSPEMYGEMLDTIFHEGRHAYQFENVYGERVEQNGELVESWRINMEVLGYEDGSTDSNKYLGFNRYLAQPIEVDARVFAERVMSQLNA